jgi:immunoglobulin-binding protein 1
LEDVSTRDLVYLLVPFVSAELETRVKATERDERMIHLEMAQRSLRTFVETSDNYDILPAADRELYEKKVFVVTNPAKKRELKIKQYQKEKELRTRIEVCGC